MIVWVSGPTGSGKSTWARAFGEQGYSVLTEEIPAQRFAAFSADPKSHCAALQEEIMISRLDRWHRLSAKDDVVFDRSVDEDAGVFCAMHHELGLLNDDQYKKLLDIRDRSKSIFPVPDLILYMDAPPEALTARISGGTHPDLIVKNIEKQISLYATWISGRQENVIRVDNSRSGPELVSHLFSSLRQC